MEPCSLDEHSGPDLTTPLMPTILRQSVKYPERVWRNFFRLFKPEFHIVDQVMLRVMPSQQPFANLLDGWLVFLTCFRERE